ncbi:MAG: hypothetical protein IKZ29_09160 [Clostridiales bacterium]|nr:hypothetical protein [Clostridiales bacterium]
MDKKKLYIIVGSAVAGTLLIVGIVAAILANRPSALLLSAAGNTAKDFSRLEGVSFAKEVANGGSVAVSANLDKYVDDITIQGKIYTDAKNNKGAYEMTIYDDDDVMVQPRIYVNKDSIVATCPEIFEGAYGVNFKKLDKNLPGSIFDPDEDTDYSLPEGVYEYLMSLSENTKGNKELQRDIEKTAARYEKFTIQTIMKYAEVTKKSDKITVGGDKISCTVITIELDEDAIVSICQDIIDYINNDKSLEDLLLRYYSANPSSNISYYSLLYGYDYDFDPEDMVDEFYDEVDDFEDRLDYIEDMDIEIEASVYITKSGKRIAQVDFESEIQGEEFECSLVLGKNVTKTKEMSFSYETSDGDKFSLEYEVEQNDAKGFEAEITYESYDPWSYYRSENKGKMTISWDKKSGDCEVKVKGEYDDFSIKGNLTKKGDKIIYVLENIKNNGTSVDGVKSLELTITIDRRDPAPKAPSRYTDIVLMDEDDFEDLYEEIEDGIEDLEDEFY